MTASPQVAVIIAAFNAQDTIGKAVKSALLQPECHEVVVVDDASSDQTSAKAKEAAAGDPRLQVIRNSQNCGPARSRNIAIAQSSAPYIAILDGDDFFLADRFAPMFLQPEWDFCADNIVFITAEEQIARFRSASKENPLKSRQLDISRFISGNLPRNGRPRGELGFLKPVMRRAFLEQHGLFYSEDCRLGEDFLFYVEALAQGARYTVISSLGYAALLRENSLSGKHSVDDLAALFTHEMSLLERLELDREAKEKLVRRTRSTLRRLHHRQVLASKANGGRVRGVMTGLTRPMSFIDIAKDKLNNLYPPQVEVPRSLLAEEYFSVR